MNPVTAHPLYRAHHGDMTGWRYLEVGEEILATDEVIDQSDRQDEWSSSVTIGAKVTHGKLDIGLAYRRRIAPTQPEAKRFVTGVFEVNDKTLEMVNCHAVQIREGNALLLLDTIEERVTKALKGQD